MILFPNLDDEVKVYDKHKSTFFSVTGEEPVICTYKKGDVLEVLLSEKPLLKGYTLIDISYVTFNKEWRVHISFTNMQVMGGGSEIIKNLDQKIRDIKLNNIGI